MLYFFPSLQINITLTALDNLDIEIYSLELLLDDIDDHQAIYF